MSVSLFARDARLAGITDTVPAIMFDPSIGHSAPPRFLLLKAAPGKANKKISEQPGMVLLGNPPRWHKVSAEEKSQHDPKMMLTTALQMKSQKKLQDDPEMAKLSPEQQVAKIKEHAQKLQTQATTAAQWSVWKKKIFAGKQPSTSEWKAFLEMPKDKRAALMDEVKADPAAFAVFTAGSAKFRSDAVVSIARDAARSGGKESAQADRTAAEEEKPAVHPAASAEKDGKPEDADKASTVKPTDTPNTEQKPESMADAKPPVKDAQKGKSPFAGKKVPVDFTVADVRAALVAAKLPPENTNAKGFNKRLDDMIAALDVKDSATIDAMKFGSNSYGQWLAKMAVCSVAALNGDKTVSLPGSESAEKDGMKDQKSADKQSDGDSGPKDGDTKQDSPEKPHQKTQGQDAIASFVDAIKNGKVPSGADIIAVSNLSDELYANAIDQAAAAYAADHCPKGDQGLALAVTVVGDILEGKEGPHDGDTKTVNGVTYILEGGRWHRQSPKDKPGDKYRALQKLDPLTVASELMFGKFSTATEQSLNVLGAEGKANVFGFAAMYGANQSSINLCATIAAVYGKPGQVLTIAGEWIPYKAAVENAVPAETSSEKIKAEALGDMAYLAEGEPTSGPDNPDAPQTFGQGTVEFHGPMSMHDILTAKGWSIAPGPDFKMKFISGKVKDWSLSPGPFIADKEAWHKAQFYLHDLLPDGATLVSFGKVYSVQHGEKGKITMMPADPSGGVVSYGGDKESVKALAELLWHDNSTIIPPGHPSGEKAKDAEKQTTPPSAPDPEQASASPVSSDDGNQDVSLPPAVKMAMLGLADGLGMDKNDKAVWMSLTQKEQDVAVNFAANNYAKNTGLDVNDPNDTELAVDIVWAMLNEEKHPEEGATKTVNGITYQLINGRWHRVTPKDESDKKSGSDKSKPNPVETVAVPSLKETFPAKFSHHEASFEQKLKDLKQKVIDQGPSALNGTIKKMKTGMVIITLPGGPKFKYKPHQNGELSMAGNAMMQYIEDLKQAVAINEGKKAKKQKAKPSADAKPDKPYTPPPKPAPSLNIGKTIQVGNAKARVIDNWKKVGEQQGSNNGGTYDDGTGQKWYCKFPSDPDVVKNEILATKFYEMMGLSVPSFRLVSKDGKLGTASKIIDGMQKKSLSELAKAPGAQEGFYVDAWLANWDVVGLGNDNLMVDSAGNAVRVDAGGSLVYRAMGGLKGSAFGDDVSELKTFLDSGMNPKTADLFANADPAKLEFGLDKVAKISPAQIKKMCSMFGPGTEADQSALADKLIARRAFILNAAGKQDPWEQAEPDITKLKVDPSNLPDPIDFNSYKDTGKPLSSKPHVNAQNTIDDKALIDFARNGNLQALLDYHYDAVDKETGTPLGKKPISEHPSKDIKNHWSDLCDLLTSIAHPPVEGLDFPPLGSSTVEEIDQEAGYLPLGTNIHNAPKESVLGYWMKLGHVGAEAADELAPEKQLFWNKALTSGVKSWYNKASSITKSLVSAIQGAGYYNHIWTNGDKEFHGKPLQSVAAQVYADAAEHEEGTIIHRWMNMSSQMMDALLKEGKGLVFQNADSMCCSVYKNWGNQSHFGSGAFLRIRYAKGAKALDTYGSGSLVHETTDNDGFYEYKSGGEMEVTTLMGQRFVVLDVKKGNASSPNGITMDLLMLPPHEGFVAEMKQQAQMGKSFSVYESPEMVAA